MSRDTGRVCAWRVCRSERIGRLAPGLARGGQGWISVPLDPPGAIAGKQSRIPHLAQWGTQANCNSSRRRPGRMTSVGIFSRVDAGGNRHPVQDPVRSGGTQSGWRRNGRTHLCRGSSSGRCQHQPRCLLADHDRRRIGVARGKVGMIEASATRRPARPRTRSWSSTTAIGSARILQGPAAAGGRSHRPHGRGLPPSSQGAVRTLGGR